ncbi:hypothetical protein [Nitrosopumilus sp.]|nr:hypothetical protein [Nitrosopumilus sp.]
MSISDGMSEFEGKRCHKSCKESFEKEWRKTKGLDRNNPSSM